MDINSVSNQTYSSVNSDSIKKTNTESESAASSSQSSSSRTNDAAIYEKSKGSSSIMDDKKIQAMIDETNQKSASLQKLIESLFAKQSAKSALAGKKGSANGVSSFTMPSSNLKDFFSNLQVDSATALKAQQEISEDGYYGVKQTSARILDFAMAIAGDDPDKIAEMREAVQKGFDQAERMWGGKLPSISQSTYDAVMSGFDAWEKRVSGAGEAQEA